MIYFLDFDGCGSANGCGDRSGIGYVRGYASGHGDGHHLGPSNSGYGWNMYDSVLGMSNGRGKGDGTGYGFWS